MIKTSLRVVTKQSRLDAHKQRENIVDRMPSLRKRAEAMRNDSELWLREVVEYFFGLNIYSGYKIYLFLLLTTTRSCFLNGNVKKTTATSSSKRYNMCLALSCLGFLGLVQKRGSVQVTSFVTLTLPKIR